MWKTCSQCVCMLDSCWSECMNSAFTVPHVKAYLMVTHRQYYFSISALVLKLILLLFWQFLTGSIVKFNIILGLSDDIHCIEFSIFPSYCSWVCYKQRTFKHTIACHLFQKASGWKKFYLHFDNRGDLLSFPEYLVFRQVVQVILYVLYTHYVFI